MADSQQTITFDLDYSQIYKQMSELSAEFAGALLTMADSLVGAAEKIAILAEELRDKQTTDG
jgi:hypothetical protein